MASGNMSVPIGTDDIEMHNQQRLDTGDDCYRNVVTSIEPASRIRIDPMASRLALAVRELRAWLGTIITASLCGAFMVTFGAQIARVDGISMAPTLEGGDRLIVNKLLYRFRPPQHRRRRHAPGT